MGWTSREEVEKKGMDISTKIIIAMIVCVVCIIILITTILIVQMNRYVLKIDKKEIESYDINKLKTKVNNLTYINIEEFSKLVGYEYHKGEFKAYTSSEDKCYVQGKEETTSFFLNDNKIYKSNAEEFSSEYSVISTSNPTVEIKGIIYASIDTINKAFNVVIYEKEKELEIYTLKSLISAYDNTVKKMGYTGIEELNFENRKALLYNCLIVKKKGGLYKILDVNTMEEILPDRYKSIDFSESKQLFYVTNSVGEMGIINMNGTTEIEPVYDTISVLDKDSNLYLVEKANKYGVVKSGNIAMIPCEYDKIGLEKENDKSNKYFILDTLIPVCKDNKWGAVDKTGKVIYEVQYDGFGCQITTVEIDGENKEVVPVLSIEMCNGVVVKKDEKYGLLDVNGKELVPVAVSNIYEDKDVNNEEKYFMIYNGEKLNVIERLRVAGLIKDKEDNKLSGLNQNDSTNNTISNSVQVNNESSNNISANINN